MTGRGCVIASRSVAIPLQFLVQVSPFPVHTVNELNLPLPRPCLELLLPEDGAFYFLASLVVHKLGNVVFLGEPVSQFFFVLIHPCLQIVSDAGVKHGVCSWLYYTRLWSLFRDCFVAGAPRNDKGGAIATFFIVIASGAWQSQESQNSKIKRQKDRAKIKKIKK